MVTIMRHFPLPCDTYDSISFMKNVFRIFFLVQFVYLQRICTCICKLGIKKKKNILHSRQPSVTFLLMWPCIIHNVMWFLRKGSDLFIPMPYKSCIPKLLDRCKHTLYHGNFIYFHFRFQPSYQTFLQIGDVSHEMLYTYKNLFSTSWSCIFTDFSSKTWT